MKPSTNAMFAPVAALVAFDAAGMSYAELPSIFVLEVVVREFSSWYLSAVTEPGPKIEKRAPVPVAAVVYIKLKQNQ